MRRVWQLAVAHGEICIASVLSGLATIVVYGLARRAGAIYTEDLARFWITVVALSLVPAAIVMLGASGINRLRRIPPFPRQTLGGECCRRCGYPRQGLAGRQCPECGGYSFIVNAGKGEIKILPWLVALACGVGAGALVTETWLAIAFPLGG